VEEKQVKKALRLEALAKLAALDEEFGLPRTPDWVWPEDKLIAGWRLACTCSACPEQYEVFNSVGEQVGYLRLRNSWFRADYPVCGGATVYSVQTKGDGIFDDNERETQLRHAIAALQARHLECIE
jgi:hypothetical protein